MTKCGRILQDQDGRRWLKFEWSPTRDIVQFNQAFNEPQGMSGFRNSRTVTDQGAQNFVLVSKSTDRDPQQAIDHSSFSAGKL